MSKDKITGMIQNGYDGEKIVVPVDIMEATFEGVPVQIITVEHGGKIEPMLPLSEIAEKIGHERRWLWDIYKRHEEVLHEYSCVLITQTHDHDGRAVLREQICFNRDGLIGLLMKLSVKRIKSEEKRERIKRFQKWGIETLGKIVAGEQTLNPAEQQLALILQDIYKRLGTIEEQFKDSNPSLSEATILKLAQKQKKAHKAAVGVSLDRDLLIKFDNEVLYHPIFANRSQAIEYSMRRFLAGV